MKNKKQSRMEKMDICVNCGKTTDYPIDMMIDLRKTYVEGAGQLCDECYDKIYNSQEFPKKDSLFFGN
jgi:NMD protein affecting ribosome stability and mRNA decay